MDEYHANGNETFVFRCLCIWWTAVRKRWLRWSQLSEQRGAIRSVNGCLEFVQSDEHASSLLSSRGAGQLYIFAGRFWFFQLSGERWAFRSARRQLVTDAQHDDKAQQLRCGCIGWQSVLYRRKWWNDVHVKLRTFEYPAECMGTDNVDAYATIDTRSCRGGLHAVRGRW